MLQNASPTPNSVERRSEATVVIADGLPVPCLVDARELAPSGARRVCDHSMGSVVEACVSLLMPEIDSFDVPVGTQTPDVERRNHLNGFRGSLGGA